MMFGMIRVMMRPQPSDGFVWVQAAGGPALVCGALRPLADHLFTTRDWALGSGDGHDDEWAPVAASLGVDLDHLVRLRQVHGAAVVVRRAGDPLPSGPRPEADIVVSNDPLVAVAAKSDFSTGRNRGGDGHGLLVTGAGLLAGYGSAGIASIWSHDEDTVAGVGLSVGAATILGTAILTRNRDVEFSNGATLDVVFDHPVSLD